MSRMKPKLTGRMADNPRSTVESLLKSSTPESVHTCLLETIKKASPGQLEGLSSLLAPLTPKSKELVHCVRCHEEYRESENNEEACQIEHDDDGEDEEFSSDEGEPRFVRSCCMDVWDGEDDSYQPYCVEDCHTTDPTEVQYHDDDRYRGEGTNMTVMRCSEAGCSKKRKRGKKDKGASSSKKVKKAKVGI
ncbi:hypothetical protein FPV67DRAFT_1511938 [Lyophyllum atratum]|nr:hypothetical protein FPV67DRAFT_1511938 [Lyophyllum atratum]